MILRIVGASDDFDQLEVLKFSYESTKGQVVTKTLTIKAVKFLTTLDGKFVYSDEPPLDIYMPDVDAVLSQDVADGRVIKIEALSKCFEVTADIFTDNGLSVIVEEA
ncbi:MAG: hypothetical protein QF704_10745 [Anaerolineales bacterium]|jgi:hypothetical protein|nr:hypothetical protein [Anaerolineales bacterium]